jgi:NADPH-dependent 2,4-dienoyl-CoA reductase/sulfur reductase-like enzyme
MRRIVIVGGVAAGMSAASQARKHDPKADITVLERGPSVSYGSCGLPYYVSGLIEKPEALVVYTAEAFSRERHVSVLARHEAVGLDPEAGVVRARTADGTPKDFPFDALVIATGARAAVPAVPGIGSDRVFTLRTLEDGVGLRRFLDDEAPSTAVVLGGGVLGLELADSLAARGIKVTVIEREAHVVPDIEPDMAELVTRELEQSGVDVRVAATVTAITPGPSAVGVLAGGDEIACDLVLVAVGVRPNSEIAAEAGVALGAGGAIAVDEGCRTSVENVFAAGDCAEVTYVPTGGRVYIPAGNTSNKQGRVAGANAAGADRRFPGVVATRVGQVFGLEVARTGLSAGQAERGGLSPVVSRITSPSRARYLPGRKNIAVAVVAERGTGKLLGAQMVGAEGCAKRIDIFGTALSEGMSTLDVADLDLSYAPPFAPVWDPVLIAAREAAKAAGAGERS